MKNVFVLGAGAWGTALALAALRAGTNVTLWSIHFEEVETINQRHENVYRLPGVALDSSLKATTDPEDAQKADVVIIVPPAQYVRSVCETFQTLLHSHVPLIIASKGIEDGTAFLMSEVVRESFPQNPLFVLSGPSFASDVSKKLPTSVTLASEDFGASQKMAVLLGSSAFQLIPSEDPIGAQVGGACKNIIAIASGILEGHNLGDNAQASVITKGLDEMARLGCAMGAKLETFLGLSGVGDLMLTSLSSQSRNKTFGLALGRGTPLDELLTSKKTLTEGLHTVTGTLLLAKKHKVDMPIVEAMNHFFYKGGSLETLIETLLHSSRERQ